MHDSVYLSTEICFSYALRKRRYVSLGLRLSPKATQILHLVCGINPQFYSATTSAEIEICWNPKTAIRKIETGSKTAWLVAYPKY